MDLVFRNRNEFEKLFRDNYVNLCRFALTFIKEESEAEEIVQEVFINIWEKREAINIYGSIRSFLYTSVRNRSLNYIRDAKTRQMHEDLYASNFKEIIGFNYQQIEKEQLEYKINEIISELPDQCKHIFELSRFGNLSYKQIADKLNLSLKTVENQIGIALKRLKTKLSPFLNMFFSLF